MVKVTGALLKWARENAGLSLSQLEQFGLDANLVGDMEHVGAVVQSSVYVEPDVHIFTAQEMVQYLASLYGVKPALFRQNFSPTEMSERDELWWLEWLAEDDSQ